MQAPRAALPVRGRLRKTWPGYKSTPPCGLQVHGPMYQSYERAHVRAKVITIAGGFGRLS